jgi:hypothetical protein
VSDDEWRIRASPRDKLLFLDPDGLRRQYIAECFKRDATALAAFDALGGKEFLSPPINIDIVRRLHDSIGRDPVNELAGMTVEGPVRKAAERDRIIIWWLLHDAYMRAKIVPERIKTEQRLRANAARKASELALIGRSDTLRGLVEITHAIADKTEPIIRRKDPARPPFSLSDAEAVQNWARLFFPEATPTWGSYLAVAFQPGDVVEDSDVGRDVALGALAVIIPALVRKRGCYRLIAKLAEALFGSEVKTKEVIYRRKVFLTQRGFLPPSTVE